MIYSDEEVRRWWQSLSKIEQAELLTMMVDKMTNPAFALSLSQQYESGKQFSAKQLDAIRRWAR